MTCLGSSIRSGSVASALLLIASVALAQTAPTAAPSSSHSVKSSAPNASVTQPAPQALATGGNVVITDVDLLAEAQQRIPPEAQNQVLSRSAGVSQLVGNLYVRRAMADQAQASGLAESPEVAGALRIARDRVLSDAWMAKIDAQHQITDTVAEGLARNLYKAKPERFKTAEQVQVRHILVAGTTAESRAQAEQLRAELQGGADFAKLAQERSADKGSGAKGGELGFFERGRMVPEFEAAAFAMTKPGQLSDVVETQFGYHIIQFEGRKPEGMRPFEEVRAELLKEVRTSVQQEARMAEVQRLQQSMTIQKDAISGFAAKFDAPLIKMAP